MSAVILTCNAGSSNTKLAAFDATSLARTAHAQTHNEAETEAWLCAAGKPGIAAIGHRVVHGGGVFTEPTILTPEVIRKLKSFIPLAPLHQPAALKLIEEARGLYPDVPQIACFDTAFHHTFSEMEKRLPLPRRFHEAGMQRYGFHGLSYQHIASALPDVARKKAEGRVIVAHLGGGASACAMKGLKSVASTMGFSTLDGLMMGTRPGALDAGVVLHMLQQQNMTAVEVSDLLYQNTGLKGVSGVSGDMRTLLESTRPEAKEAVELYCYLAAKQIAGLLPALGGLDMLVFTGGIGEHAEPVREQIVSHLRWIGDFAVYVVPTDEEVVIAEACHIDVKELTFVRHAI